MKAIYGLLTSPKKWTDEFVLFAFLLFTANKSNSSVRFLGEFEDTKKSFRNYLTFSRWAKLVVLFCLGFFECSYTHLNVCHWTCNSSTKWARLSVLILTELLAKRADLRPVAYYVVCLSLEILLVLKLMAEMGNFFLVQG